MSRALTYDDFYRTGVQDCGNVLSIDDFDLDAGTPKQVVDKAWAEWEADGMEDQWLEQQDDLEGLDPHKCYEAWKDGWKSCAVVTLKEHIERAKQRRLDDFIENHNNPPAGWWRRPVPAPRPCYRTKADALKAFLDVNYEIVENYGGADYAQSPAEFDSINRKYGLKGKRAARSIADAVWYAMPVGKPFCLDRIDLDALNDTSPAREAGVAFRLPDFVYEAKAMEEEARRISYGQAEDEGELPDWVTEHERKPSPLPSMEDIVLVELEEQEPGVATFRMIPSTRVSEAMPPALTRPVLPQPKPMRLQLEEREPGVETYRMFSNPGRKFKEGDIVRRTAAAMRSMGVVSGPVNGMVVGYSGRWPLIQWSDMGDDEEPMAQAEDGLELDKRAMALRKTSPTPWWAFKNPPPGEHPRRVAARRAHKPSDDVYYLLNEDEEVIGRHSTLNDALTALAKLRGDGRISLGDSTGTGDIIAWTGPPYAEDGDPEMGELTIVDARDIRRMFSLAMIRRFNEERMNRKENPATENPAWVTKIIAKNFEKLEEEVPPAWLPKLTKTTASRGKLSAAMKEYGCGAYGCVLPTLDPKVVLKLTTDDTEAEFASDLAGKLTVPVVVKYHLTRALPEKYKGRESFLLWRDAADHVGDVAVVVSERGGDGSEVEEAIGEQHAAAQEAYDALFDGEPAGELLEKWEVAARAMGKKVPELRYLAEGMITNLHKDRVFMGDVHSGNIGLVGKHWIVVDPGNIAVIVKPGKNPY